MLVRAFGGNRDQKFGFTADSPVSRTFFEQRFVSKGLQFSDKEDQGQASSQTWCGEVPGIRELPLMRKTSRKEPSGRPPLAIEKDARRVPKCKAQYVLLLRTDVRYAGSISSSSAAVSANVVVKKRFNHAATERSSSAGIVRDGHVCDSRSPAG